MNDGFELLAPAGSLEICKAVIDAGADAVYLGGQQFGARAYANNFSKEELLEALNYAHLRGKKIYLTINTLLKNEELNALYDYLLPYYEHGLDAVIVQDIGALSYIHNCFPDLEIHTSTQMTVTGADGIRLLQQLGVTRVVMAREVSVEEMKYMQEQTGIELEAFVHGALCYSYSGQCLFSSMLGGRSGNRGRCAQPCRLPYKVDNKEKYILSLKDFCGIEKLPLLYDAGVYSLKIEGRMKQLSYAVGVVSYYRKYIDLFLKQKNNFLVSHKDKKELQAIGSRCGFTDTYFDKHNGTDMVTFEKPSFQQTLEVNPHEKVYQKIEGHLILQKDHPALFKIRYHDIEVTSVGAVVQKAMKQPLIETDLKQRLEKIKDTAFEFLNIKIEMEEDVFLPNGAINQLKRDAIHQLEELILNSYKKDSAKNISILKNNTIKEQKQIVVASIEKQEQLTFVLEQDCISAIYIDSNIDTKQNLFTTLKEDVMACHQNKKQAYLILPYIFRKNTSDFWEAHIAELKDCSFDGFVVKNYEEIWFIKKHFGNIPIIADHNLYTYNDIAINELDKLGVARNTMPLELNKKEIMNRNNHKTEMIVYGYYPLMTSAQCVHKNTKGCDKTSCITYIKDRYNKSFPVKNYCNDCYNVIYNCLPTMLLDNIKELNEIGVSYIRLHFSMESKKEMVHIFELLNKKCCVSKKQIYTNGHYKRGVE